MTDEIAALRARLEAAEARSVRLAEALRWNAARSYADGRLPCWCPLPPDDAPDAWHASWCLNARAALAEHDASQAARNHRLIEERNSSAFVRTLRVIAAQPCTPDRGENVCASCRARAALAEHDAAVRGGERG